MIKRLRRWQHWPRRSNGHGTDRWTLNGLLILTAYGSYKRGPSEVHEHGPGFQRLAAHGREPIFERRCQTYQVRLPLPCSRNTWMPASLITIVPLDVIFRK